MEDLRVYKVLSLPKVLVPNAIYLVPEKKSQTVQIMVANKEGTGVLPSINEAHIRALIQEEHLSYHFDQPCKRNYSILLIVLFLILLVIIGLIWYWCSLPKLPAYQLKVMPFVQNVSGSGVVKKVQIDQIFSPVDGVVKTVQVHPGNDIKEKDILLEFESNKIDEELNTIEQKFKTLIERKKRQAQLEAELAKLQLDQADAELKRRQITILSKKQQEAFKDSELRLRKGHIVSKEEQESFKAAKKIAEKNDQIKQLKLNKEFENLEEIEDLRLLLELAQLKNHSAIRFIHANVNGKVVATHVKPNDVVKLGQLLFVIESNHPTEIKIQLDEKHLSQLYLKRKGMVTIKSYPKQHFPATIDYIAPHISKSGKIEVGLNLDQPPSILLHNMKVSFNIETTRLPNALVIPNDALRIEEGSDKAEVIVVRQGRVHKTSVGLGLQGEMTSQVTSGLREDDIVLINTPLHLEENQRIRILKKGYPE